MKMMKLVGCAGAVLALGGAVRAAETDVIEPLPAEAVEMRGSLGAVLDKSIRGWILGDVPYHRFAQFFRDGRPQFAVGEMWGKFVRSGCMFYRYRHDAAVKARMADAVRDILALERPNGSISCNPPQQQPGNEGGDLWERKYVMLGLLGYYTDVERDPKVLASLIRQADAIIDQIGPAPRTDVRNLGWSLNHIESSTILEPFMRLYGLTGERRFLDFAKYLVDCGGTRGTDLVQTAFDMVPPHLMAGAYPKGYETTSYFEGLVDYCRVTGDRRVRRACLNYFRMVRDREMTIAGNGGVDMSYNPTMSGEGWGESGREQTNPDVKRMMETCVGITWLKYCSHILRLTGDCTAPDAIEKYVYNGLVGAMKPDGTGFSYVNLLDGLKVAKEAWGWDFDGNMVTCCNLNGPMGLAYIPYVAVMQANDGPVVNIYSELTAKAKTPSGAPLTLEMATDYPLDGKVSLRIALAKSERFAVRLRNPSASEKTVCSVNGAAVPVVAGGAEYILLDRTWKNGDEITLEFRFTCRLIPGPHGVNRAGDGRVAVMYGPILLTRDEDIDPKYDEPVKIVASADGHIAARRLDNPPAPARIAFEIPTASGPIIMTDYASADCWDGSHIRTWLKIPTAD